MNTHDVLRELVSKPYMPFTVMQLRGELDSLFAAQPEKEPAWIVDSFLNQRVRELIEAINIPLLNQITVAIKTKIVTRDIQVKDLKLAVSPSADEATEFCSIVHVEMQQTQQEKEELLHYLSFFTQALGYVTSLASASEILLREYFESRKELKTRKDAILNDLEVYKVYLKNAAKELERISEDVLSPRINLCMRMESSLRLLERYRDPSLRGFTVTT